MNGDSIRHGGQKKHRHMQPFQHLRQKIAVVSSRIELGLMDCQAERRYPCGTSKIRDGTRILFRKRRKPCMRSQRLQFLGYEPGLHQRIRAPALGSRLRVIGTLVSLSPLQMTKYPAARS